MKSIMVALSVLTLLLGWDFVSRLLPQTAADSQSLAEDLTPLPVVALLDEAEKKRIDKRLERFLNKNEPQQKTQKKQPKKQPQQSQKPDIMPAEQQAQQQGQLTELFDGVSRFTLRATFSKGLEPFAIVEQKNLESKKIESVEIRKGERLASYQVDNITEFSVSLSQGQRQIILQLFKTN